MTTVTSHPSPTPLGRTAWSSCARRRVAYRQAFLALLQRDLHVLFKNLVAVHRPRRSCSRCC